MMRLVCFALLLFGITACGSSENNPQPATANSNPPTQVAISDGDATDAPTTPTTDESGALSHIDCGDIAVNGNPPRALDKAEIVHAASACFAKAYASCTAATLTIHERDTKFVRQFTIEPGTKCDVRQALQPDPNSPPAVVDCESVRVENDQLMIARCSHLGDFILTLAN